MARPTRQAEVKNSDSDHVSEILIYLQNTKENFKAGKISNARKNWQSITSDANILEYISGYSIEFESIPRQQKIPVPISFNDLESDVIQTEIDNLLAKGIIEPICKDDNNDEYISNIFVRPKKNGKFRIILNLRNLNDCVEYHHFKMETLKTAISLVSKNCYFGSIDLQDAYYSCTVNSDDRKYLRFIWKDQKYQFTCLVMGLASSPRIFTKLMKPVFSTLRKQGYANVSYIDDTLLIGKTKDECESNIKTTALLLDSLGLTVNLEKSSLNPETSIEFLGFVIDSERMTVSLTTDRAESIRAACQNLLHTNKPTIRQFAQVIGKLVASESGVAYAALHYKNLEIEKDSLLKLNAGNFDNRVDISADAKKSLEWWLANVHKFPRKITQERPVISIKSDSSLKGWGAVNKNSGECIQGEWSLTDAQNHINFLELKAGMIAVKTFCKYRKNCHVRIALDNAVSVSYINKMGGRIRTLNELVRELWEFCIDQNIWLSSCHVTSRDNHEADYLSRHSTNTDMECMLDKSVFDMIMKRFGQCDVDLFASRDNHQMRKYVSYFPDKMAYAIDAFSIPWNNFKSYIFCPFSIMGNVLQKIVTDQAEAVVIAPIWATQPWFPILLDLVCEDSYILPKVKKLLHMLKNPQKEHPLTKMRLGAFRVSGDPFKTEDYQGKLSTYSCHPGETQQRNNIGHFTRNGCYFVTRGKLVYLRQM